MSFKVEKTEIEGLLELIPEVHGDDRGFFVETYKKSEFDNIGIKVEFLQDNLSQSSRGTIRGLHYQLNPYSQGKLLSAIAGKIYEVAVDIRKGSPTFGKWHGVLLTSKIKNLFWIPPGFAAGMAALEDGSILAYKTTAEYSKDHERGILWNDPSIGIIWPKEIIKPIMSDKDIKHPPLSKAEINFEFKK